MDSLFCGKATGRRTCHRHVRLDGPFEPILKLKMSNPLRGSLIFWWRRMDSNHRRQSQQIYSLSPLATWVLLRIQLGGRRWSWWTDSNPRPADYKSAALPAELHQHRSLPRYSGAYYNSRKRACQPFFKKNFKRRGDGPTRRYGILNPRGSRGAPCARGSSTPATPILSWTAGRCASTAWAGMPGGTSPGSCAGWPGRRGTSRSTVF